MKNSHLAFEIPENKIKLLNLDLAHFNNIFTLQVSNRVTHSIMSD